MPFPGFTTSKIDVQSILKSPFLTILSELVLTPIPTMNHITDQSLFVFLLASGEILVFLIKETYVVCATPFFFFLTQNKCDAWSWAAFFDSEVLSMNSRPKGLHDPWS